MGGAQEQRSAKDAVAFLVADGLFWEVARSAISDRTVGNILRRLNIAPAPDRSRTTNWIRSHMEVLAAADFLTVGVLKWRGLVTYYTRFSSK
jgi:hypothetical protein